MDEQEEQESDFTAFRRYSKTVETMAEAWAFVMHYTDEFELPSVEIQPMRVGKMSEAGEVEPVIRFGVSVYGNVTIKDDSGVEVSLEDLS